MLLDADDDGLLALLGCGGERGADPVFVVVQGVGRRLSLDGGAEALQGTVGVPGLWQK